MRIVIVTPAPPGSRQGNRISALRWSRMFRDLGHRVVVSEEFVGQPCHLLVVLHARKSAVSVRRFRTAFPDKPIIVVLTGTDLYSDIHHNASARESLDSATRLVLLQPHGIRELPEAMRGKAAAIIQSVLPLAHRTAPRQQVWEVCVVGHLRPVKDPFRTALAARGLPRSSRLRVIQLGAALSPDMERRARMELWRNPRYEWLGDRPHWQCRRRLARSRLLVLTSKMEGGANVVCEALADGVPVISSRISGSIGILGEDYPGYFPVGDTQSLRELLLRSEQDAAFYDSLTDWCRQLKPLVDPERERRLWRELLSKCTQATHKDSNEFEATTNR